MISWFFSSSSPLHLLVIFLLLPFFHLPQSSATGADQSYNNCRKEFNCGNITGLTYPFWGYDRPLGCGLLNLQLNCHDGVASIEIKGVDYRILGFNRDDQTLKIARQDYLKGICLADLVNTTLDPQLFDYAYDYQYATFFYGCPSPLASAVPVPHFTCPTPGVTQGNGFIGAGSLGPGACNASVVIPVLGISFVKDIVQSSNLDQAIGEVIGEGFEVRLKVDSRACSECRESKGACGYELNVNQTTCFCKDQLQPSKTCTSSTASGPSQTSSGSSPRPSAWIKIGIGISVSVGGIMTVFAIIYGHRRKSCSLGTTCGFLKKKGKLKDDQNMEAFMRNYGSFAPKRFNYSDVKKMTNSFADKLGQGGFGRVYKGELPDGRVVAVKVLNEWKATGDEFINEVASISRTSHANVVMLIGFCYEGAKRALIYEFMSNGSLDKYIPDAGFLDAKLQLPWKTMYEIAVGIGRGLDYLHRGCQTRILHFDIKPHNILLDQDLCPKISDFGLAKLCQRKESMISITGARGTVGYIAPEVYCRSFGRVSHKSDVYSYGMLLLAMVGGRKNCGATASSDVYFPDWIYKRLEEGKDMILERAVIEEEEEIARKLILVSLWCIQTNPLDRPSMGKVVEMLEGNLQAMQTPPKPFLYSPTKSPQHSSTTSPSLP